jgi:hypothetical protein
MLNPLAPISDWHAVFRCATGLGLALMSAACFAAPEEIQVYLDDLTEPGRFGTDLHNNFVISGSSTPDHEGAIAPRHVYRFTPEFYYGVTNTLELGLYLLTTISPGFITRYEGEKLRVKYIAPHDEDHGSFWGANLEIGKTSIRVSEAPWNAELKGIYGYRTDRWTFAVNSNFDWSLSGQVNTPVSLELDTKLAYKTDAGPQLGIETYNELGPLRDLGHVNKLSQALYGVIDTQLGQFDLNAGIGRGLTSVSDRWVLKFIVGIHY